MKSYRDIVWKWSWVVTIPVSLFFIAWAWSTVHRYYTFGVVYDAAPMEINIKEIGELEFANMMRNFQLSVNPSTFNKRNSSSKFDSVHLFSGQGQLAKLDSNLPHSGFEYVDGGILQDGKVEKVKLRYRGDFANHWGFHKKSYRIKTKKNQLYQGMRKFNLTAPKGKFQLHNYLGYRLASYLGLIVPKHEMVNVTMNGKNKGLHLMVEQLEELVLRNNKRMPGDIYAGELVAKDSYNGVNNNVFEHPGLWSKQASNNHYELRLRKPLERLVSFLQQPMTDDVQANLSAIVDIEQWGRFSAFEALAQTFHIDHAHNWRLYYDPMRSVFEPIIWDPTAWIGGWGSGFRPDMIRTALHRALFRNGQFLRARQSAFEEFYSKGLDRAFLLEMDDVVNRVSAGLSYDVDIFYSENSIREALSAIPLKIRDSIAYIKKEFIDLESDVTYAELNNGIALQLLGRKPVRAIVLNYLSPLPNIESAKIKYWVNDLEVEKDISGGVFVNGNQLIVDISFIGGFEVNLGKTDVENRLTLTPGYYEIELDFGQQSMLKKTLLEVNEKKANGQISAVPKVLSLPRSSFSGLFDIAQDTPVKNPIVWRGEVTIEADRVVDRDLVIMPGTRVRMMPGALLEIRGRLLAAGEPEEPVSFEPFDRIQEPWGAVVLRGDGANDSLLKYCKFDGGSGVKRDLFEYTAMFSVHASKGVVVQNSFFSNSKMTDDMVHVVYSDIIFDSTVFENSLLDGVDIDVSDAVLSNVKFLSSGNDALDLMASDVVVVDAAIAGSGDKGVSVGEGSKLLMINSVLTDNEIGVEVKDGSISTLINVEFTENKKALNAYKKNWRYGSGGKVFLHKSIVKNNASLSSVDKLSRIYISDSYFDEEPSSANVIFKKGVNKNVAARSASKSLDLEAVEIPLIDNLPTRFEKLIDSSVRGRASN